MVGDQIYADDLSFLQPDQTLDEYYRCYQDAFSQPYIREQRSKLLEFIQLKKVRRVVFLSGDVHASTSAELVSPEAPEFKIISIISSAFFWSYPHTPSKSFILNGKISSNSEVQYEVVKAGPVHATDNFSRFTADVDRVKVEVFSRKGELLGTKIHSY